MPSNSNRNDRPKTEQTSTNPKDAFGKQKPGISTIPAVALIHESLAMRNGAEKYGPYNWRTKTVSAQVYVDAVYRHVMAWFDGERNAPDSGIHHLGHARASLGILLDAEEQGTLVDDRPTPGKASEVLERLTKRTGIPNAQTENGGTRNDQQVFRSEREMPVSGVYRGVESIPEGGSTQTVGPSNANTPTLQTSQRMRDVRVSGSCSGLDIRSPGASGQDNGNYPESGGSYMGSDQGRNSEVPNSMLQLPHDKDLRERGIERQPQVRKNRVYLSGPMRGIKDFNFPAFDRARDLANVNGLVAISPADIDRENGIHETTELPQSLEEAAHVNREFVERDVKALLSLRAELGDAIALLPGWEKSTGAVAEFFIARWLGLAIRDATDMFYFSPKQIQDFDATPIQRAVVNTMALRRY